MQLFTTGDQTVTGNITLASVNSFQNVTTFGLLGGVRVPQLYQSLFYYPDLDSFNDTLIQQCEVLDELHLTQQSKLISLIDLFHYSSFPETQTMNKGR